MSTADINPFTLNIRNNKQANNVLKTKMMENVKPNIIIFVLMFFIRIVMDAILIIKAQGENEMA